MSPRGIVLDRDLSKVHPVDANSPEEIKEYIYHSWYTEGDKSGGPPNKRTRNPLVYRREPSKHLNVDG